ncbi:two-component system response regulator-like protein [Methylophaga frappieri]|uniref:diguanylate cyclase n=1 Tax=Methylophaga frappieri (strain ATCC BAA-2434 / DSM 25690 / JAM7) TaxID=754477 RepID=I1YJY2_METFJ|nr:diguanylate cyclase [Methylophaga frappieri]AFJ03225.1 two-component system response regulator-like protein [Methylophaga frappieri]
MRKDKKNIFLFVTLVILIFDGLFVWTNYTASKDALHETLSQRGEQLRHAYQITLDQLSSFMLQTATYIANDQEVTTLFHQGKVAVEAEGGGPGGETAAEIRSQLYAVVERGWQALRKDFKVRQLHFHLPIDISFLRVHKPEKFGDDLSEIRHSVVATNTEQIPSSGFESGRVYAGIRGVVPVFYRENVFADRHHVGALEAGTSFNLMLDDLKSVLNAEFAVLMTMAHAEETMWPDFLKDYVKTKLVIKNHLLEASTNEQQINNMLNQTNASQLLGDMATKLILVNNKAYAMTSFPLIDYLGSVDPERNPIGTILVWTPADDELAEFHRSNQFNILLAILGFLVVESLLYWAIRIESRLKVQQEIALRDGLTGVYNRRAFDERYKEEFFRSKREQDDLSILMIDIDYFKIYNDHYGHLAGDDCIRRVVDILRKNIKRSGDVLARYGGEEFVVILPATDEHSAFRIAEQLRVQVADAKIMHEENKNSDVVTISCGVASFKFDNVQADIPPEALLGEADKALYKAKNQGRNTVCIA